MVESPSVRLKCRIPHAVLHTCHIVGMVRSPSMGLKGPRLGTHIQLIGSWKGRKPEYGIEIVNPADAYCLAGRRWKGRKPESGIEINSYSIDNLLHDISLESRKAREWD